MSTHNTEAWRNNVQEKSKEIQTLIKGVFALLPNCEANAQKAQFQEKLGLLTEKAKAFHYLYGSSLIPVPLRELTNTLTQWQGNLNHADYTLKIANLFDPVGTLVDYEEPETSFTSILDKHRDDETLQGYLSNLIDEIRRILEIGDEQLSKQAGDDLQEILKEIEKRRRQSPIDLSPWVEFALVTLGCIADVSSGAPLGTIAAAALIAAKNSNARLGELVQMTMKEYLDSIKIRASEKLLGPMRRKLLNASVEQIEKAVLVQGGLSLLPDCKQTHALNDKVE